MRLYYIVFEIEWYYNGAFSAGVKCCDFKSGNMFIFVILFLVFIVIVTLHTLFTI